jgi:hypothetical protein
MTVTVGLTVTMTVVKVKRRMTMLRLTSKRGWVLNLRKRKDKKNKGELLLDFKLVRSYTCM